MKKAIAILLCAILLLGCVSALAATDQEVFFRNVFWDTARYNLGQCEIANGLPFNGKPGEEKWVSDTITDNIHPIPALIEGEAALPEGKSTEMYSDIGMKVVVDGKYYDVAGAVPSYTNYYFAYLTENGQLAADTLQKSRLYAGQYVFEVPADAEQMFEDFNAKLSGLYGEADEVKETAEDKHIYWYGYNDTGVALSLKQGEEQMKIIITYFTKTGNTLLDDAYKALNGLLDAASSTSTSTNTNGL